MYTADLSEPRCLHTGLGAALQLQRLGAHVLFIAEPQTCTCVRVWPTHYAMNIAQ